MWRGCCDRPWGRGCREWARGLGRDKYTFVEALKGVTFRLILMWEIGAEKMIQPIRAYKVLQGTGASRRRTSTPSRNASCVSCSW